MMIMGMQPLTLLMGQIMADPKDEKVLVVIPVRGTDAEDQHGPLMLGKKPLISYTIDAALSCSSAQRVIVSTDSESVQRLAIELGAEAPFLRPKDLSEKGVTLDRVLQHTLIQIADPEVSLPEFVLTLEIAHPFRPNGLLEQLINSLIEQDLDTVFAAFQEKHVYWKPDEYGAITRVGVQGTTTREKAQPLYREMAGLGIATKLDVLKTEGRFGQLIGLVPLQDFSAIIDTQDPDGLLIAESYLNMARPGDG